MIKNEEDENENNFAYTKPFEGGDLPISNKEKDKSMFESAIDMDSAYDIDNNNNKSDFEGDEP